MITSKGYEGRDLSGKETSYLLSERFDIARKLELIDKDIATGKSLGEAGEPVLDALMTLTMAGLEQQHDFGVAMLEVIDDELNKRNVEIPMEDQ
jgi:hypothetical protein